jgi:glycosyltransferase involved in cell wall biosynthesis
MTPPLGGWPGISANGAKDSAPFLSVIVTAHDRRRYLKEAVESLLRQTISRTRFEVLVVKNFEDAEIDGFLQARKVEHWVTSAVPLAAKILEAFGRSRGRVVAFLEDDDLYLPQRLATVEEAFLRDPELGFFRNGFDVIDEEGRPFTGWLPDALRTSRDAAPDLSVRDAEKDPQYRRLVDCFPDFNTSTMAIRRDLFESVVPILRRGEWGVDRFLFYAALAGSGSLRLDHRRLTLYRVHPENTGILSQSRSDRLRRVDRILANERASEAVIYELVRRSPRKAARHEVEGRRLVGEAYLLLGQPPSDRRRMAGILGRLPRYRDTQPVRANRRLALEGLVYLLFPGLARGLHRRRL